MAGSTRLTFFEITFFDAFRIRLKGVEHFDRADIDLGRQASGESTKEPFVQFYLVKPSKRFETTFVDVFVAWTQETLRN